MTMMKGRTRRFYKDILMHCYQRTTSNGLLAYSVSDFLVLLTIMSTAQKKYDLECIKLCFMFDHLHWSGLCRRRQDLSAFVHDYTTLFVRERNRHFGLHGPLFCSPFGSAPKIGDKAARTNCIYVDNNPVERKMCERAEQYQWNFLAYAVSDHPFSEPYRAREASTALRRARLVVKQRATSGRHLGYRLLSSFFAPLGKKEREQLTDYIITCYNFLDYPGAIRYFGSYEKMLAATHTTTGSEYDLNEIFIGKSDAVYYKLIRLVLARYRLTDIHEILHWSLEEKFACFRFLHGRTAATAEQVAKFLAMPLQRVRGASVMH